MPNPLTLTDAPDLTDRSIRRINIKNMSKHGKVGKVLREFKKGTLHTGKKGPGKGPVVKGRKQAVAIALSEARKAGEKIPPPKKKSRNVMSDGGFIRRRK